MENNLKIVIISSVIYPRNSPRSNRATELAKEFGRLRYDVTLYGVLGSYNYSDFEKLYNVKVKNLGKNFFSNFNSSTYNVKDPFISRVAKKVIGKWLEFPSIDLARLTYRSLKMERNIDLLITIAVPYPIHWGAALYRSIFPDHLVNTTWVADCGDPYMGNPFHDKAFYFKYVEKWFCNQADYLSVPISEAKQAYYPEFRNKIKVIPQGFNFDEVQLEKNYATNPVPTFVYAGAFYPKIRDPRPLLNFLIDRKYNFKFIVYTKNQTLLDEYKLALGDKLVVNEYISRESLLIELSKADFVLNLENNTSLQSPSKLIDYALCKRPILSINSSQKLDTIRVTEFLEGNYRGRLVIDDIEKYNILNVSKRFLDLVMFHP